MCGIGGFKSEILNAGHLNVFKTVQAHRGPDAYGVYENTENNVFLAHNRLSIMDLSAVANQPMFSDDGNLVVVFNGEVFNFQDLKKELSDYPFRTEGDTEVLLAGFKTWGPSFVERLRGMFAFAIYDIKNDSIFLYRDRLGIKPLYYSQFQNSFVFASELESIYTLFKGKLSINKTAIYDFLHVGYIPQPATIWNEISKFPAGYYACLEGSKLKFCKPYWSAEKNIMESAISNETEAIEKLEFALEKSIAERLISDVPLGTFLSGGIDSSLISAMAQKQISGKLNTFSIGFKDSKKNEAPHARQVADYIGSDHHELMVDKKEIVDLIPSLTEVYQEPFSDSSAFPTLLISQFAKNKITVAFSGDGGDELFHGYGAYQWAPKLNNPFVKALKPVFNTVLKLGPDRYQRASHLFENAGQSSIEAHIFSQEQYMFSASEISQLTNTPYSFFYINPELKRALSPAESQAFFDLENYLKDDLLVKVDRASMKYGMEVRLPLLDHSFVELALNIDSSLKIRGKEQKYILKKILYKYIPEKYFNRPKEGFSIPLNELLKDELRYLVEKYLSKSFINTYGLLNYKYVKQLKDKFYTQKQDYLYNRIWLLIVLGMWLEKYD